MGELLDALSGSTCYVVVAAIVLLESVLVLGPFVPSLTTLITAGAMAGSGHASVPGLVATATAAAVSGDALAYLAGRRAGAAVMAQIDRRPRLGTVWRKLSAVLVTSPGPIVGASRFGAVARTITPHVAGVTGVPYRTVLGWGAPAAAAWASAEIGAGAAGSQWLTEHSWLVPALAPALVAVLVFGRTRLGGAAPSRAQQHSELGTAVSRCSASRSIWPASGVVVERHAYPRSVTQRLPEPPNPEKRVPCSGGFEVHRRGYVN